MEIWKGIVGFEDFYEVSNFGNVNSLSRTILRNGKYPFTKKGKKINPSKDKNGYLRVSLSRYGKAKTRNVHQLVAESFLNHIPSRFKLVVNHINLNKLDNRVENLEIITARENSNKKHIKSGSQYVGVTWSEKIKKWKSTICIKKTNIHLGYFTNEIDAHNAYQNKLKEITISK